MAFEVEGGRGLEQQVQLTRTQALSLEQLSMDTLSDNPDSRE